MISVSQASVERAAAQLVDSRDGFERVLGQDAINVIEATRKLEYRPRSGLNQNFDQAVVEQTPAGTLVTVPLQGTNVPEMTKVSYLTTDGLATVTEMVSNVIDDTHAGFKMWQDNNLVKDVLLYDPDANDEGMLQAGLSWSKLNRCLASAGVNGWIMALLSVACGAACVTMVGCAPCLAAAGGFGLGTVSACVNYAWT